MNTRINQAFSLVELSIVLVILGLLTGGILTGQSLIKAAELRAVTTEFSNYQTAINGFKNKYFAIPGDMNNATLFWGKLSAHCNSDAGTAQTNGTCNGNGDGVMNDNGAGGTTESERFTFWQQMALAGLIEGQFTGLSGSGSGDHGVPGQNVPASRYSGAAWDAEAKNSSGTSDHYGMEYGNTLKLAAPQTNNEIDEPALTPEETWNIDKKVDDGKPGRGTVIARFWDTCTTSTSNSDLNGDYALNITTKECAIYFRNAYK